MTEQAFVRDRLHKDGGTRTHLHEVRRVITSNIEVRRPGFQWPDDLGVAPLPDDPEASCELLAVSFTMPYIEPYLIRSMRTSAKLVGNPKVRADMKAFSGQEAQHYQQHAKVNDIVRGQFTPATAAAMHSLEDRLEADYRRFSDTRSDRFNLAYAEGFEAMTFSLARSLMTEAEVASADPDWRRLVVWHLGEEVEHRTVTFDAYDTAFGNRPYRTAVGVWAQLHYLRYIVAMAAVCRRDLVPQRATNRQSAWYSFRRHLRLGTVRSLGGALSPRYNPRKVPLPGELVRLAEEQGVVLA